MVSAEAQALVTKLNVVRFVYQQGWGGGGGKQQQSKNQTCVFAVLLLFLFRIEFNFNLWGLRHILCMQGYRP